MASIKLHARSGHDSADGTTSCDFRGELAVHPPVDHHKTLYEIDPASEELVNAVLQIGPTFNRLMAQLDVAPSDIAGALTQVGAGTRLRLGVWDN